MPPPRCATLTMAVLTLMVYIYYTTDVTAEMTSGVPEVPVHTFEDVIEHGYKVIVSSGYNEYLLSQAGFAIVMDSWSTGHTD